MRWLRPYTDYTFDSGEVVRNGDPVVVTRVYTQIESPDHQNLQSALGNPQLFEAVFRGCRVEGDSPSKRMLRNLANVAGLGYELVDYPIPQIDLIVPAEIMGHEDGIDTALRLRGYQCDWVTRTTWNQVTTELGDKYMPTIPDTMPPL